MANESTAANISHLINPVWETALWFMANSFVMPSLSTVFADRTGEAVRKVSEYVDDSNDVKEDLGETDDLTATPFGRDLLQSLSPEEIGKQYILTDRRVETDNVSVVADAGKAIGYSLGKKMEKYMLGHVTDFTADSYGSAANRFSMDMLYWGRTKLEAEGVAGPYYTVIHPYQFRDIQKDFVKLTNSAPLDIRNEFQRSYYVTDVADFKIVVSNLVPFVRSTGATWSGSLGSASGGTYKLGINGEVTGDIAFDAVELAITTAINLLDGVTAGDIVVDTDAPGAGYDFTLTAAANLISEDLDIHIYTADLTGFTDVPFVTRTSDGAGYYTSGMWNREALALDMRRGLRIEPERDASLRHTELNATMMFGHGVWRPNHGVQLKSQATLAVPS